MDLKSKYRRYERYQNFLGQQVSKIFYTMYNFFNLTAAADTPHYTTVAMGRRNQIRVRKQP
jgi:hypothetical protein